MTQGRVLTLHGCRPHRVAQSAQLLGWIHNLGSCYLLGHSSLILRRLDTRYPVL